MINMSMWEIRNAHSGHWFDPASMRFFRSRVGTGGYRSIDGKRAYFVSSEQFDDHTPRLYTVRCLDLTTGRITDEGEFQQYETNRAATKAAHAAAMAKDGGIA